MEAYTPVSKYVSWLHHTILFLSLHTCCLALLLCGRLESGGGRTKFAGYCDLFCRCWEKGRGSHVEAHTPISKYVSELYHNFIYFFAHMSPLRAWL